MTSIHVNNSEIIGLPVGIKATGAIHNPWYLFPARTAVLNFAGPSPAEDTVKIAPCCQVALPKYGMRLFFEDDHIGFVFTRDDPRSYNLVNPIRDFVTYKTFIDYNLVGLFGPPADDHICAENDVIRFGLQRLIRVETERREGDTVARDSYHDSKDAYVDLAVADLSQYPTIVN